MSAWRLTLALSALFFVACASAPPLGQDVITAVEIRGGEVADEPELEEGLASREDEIFDVDVLEKDLERIRRFYRANGYYEASVSAARVVREGKQKVRVEIEVIPGEPVLVSKLEIRGLETLPEDLREASRETIETHVGSRLVESTFHADARAIERSLADESYAFAKVVERAEVSVAKRTARIEYVLTPGPKAVFGDVALEGVGGFDEEVIRGTLGLEKGEAYSKREIDAAQKRLFALGVFSTVEIRPNLKNPERRDVPIRVVLTPGTTHSLHFGAVVEQDSVRTLAGLRLGWESRNFLGGLRHFSADATPGLILYPIAKDVPLKVLPTVTSSFLLEQPAFIDPRTTGFVESNLNVYPVLYSDFDPDDNIIGFQEAKGGVGIERPFAGDTLRLRPSYNAQVSVPFMYLGEKPAGLDTVFIFFPEVVGEADFRDNPVDPRSGAYFRLQAQLAGFILGDADDLRIEPETRLYGKISESVSLAYRGALGFLFPNLCEGDHTRGCYGDSLERAASVPADDPAVVRDQQILLFRGFFSGGSTSNRGYNQGEVGPHGVLGFLVPSNTDCTVENPPDSCIRPLGGFTLWEQSFELRAVFSETFGAVFFVDASDVTRKTASFRAGYPHISAGSGARLHTPVGAVRLDVGYRIPYLQALGEKELPPEEGNPDTILGAPIAFHFGLGEAF